MFSNIAMDVKGSLVIGLCCWLFTQLLRPEDAKWFRGAPTFIAIFIFAFGMIAGNIFFYYAVLLLLIPACARTRAQAIALYPIALLSLPQMSAYVTLGSSQLLALDKWHIFALGLLICSFAFPKSEGRNGKLLDPVFLMFLFIEIVQIRGGNFTTALRGILSPVIVFCIPYYFISRSLKEVEDIRRTILSFVFMGFVLGGVAVFESRKGFLIYQTIIGALHMPVNVVSAYSKGRGGALRAPTSFDESTSFALFLAFTMLFTLSAKDTFKNRRSWIFAILMNGAGIMAANSRNAFVGLAIGLPLYDLFRKRYASLTAKIGTIAGTYIILLALAQFWPYAASIIGKSDETSGTNDYRRQLFHRGMQEIAAFPLGMSTEQIGIQLRDLHQGEGLIDIVNGYIGYGLAAGYPGMLILLLIFMVPCFLFFIRRRRLRFDIRVQRYSGAIFAIAGLSAVTSFFTGFGHVSSTFYLIVMAIGSAVLNLRAPNAGVPNDGLTESPQRLLERFKKPKPEPI